MMKTKDWIKVFIELIDTLKIASEADNHVYNFMYKGQRFHFCCFGYKASRMGFMIIWNDITREAFRISRMEIPKEISFHDIENQILYHQIIPANLIFSLKYK